MKIHQKRLLDKGKIEALVDTLRSIHSSNPEIAKTIRTEAARGHTEQFNDDWKVVAIHHIHHAGGEMQTNERGDKRLLNELPARAR